MERYIPLDFDVKSKGLTREKYGLFVGTVGRMLQLIDAKLTTKEAKNEMKEVYFNTLTSYKALFEAIEFFLDKRVMTKKVKEIDDRVIPMTKEIYKALKEAGYYDNEICSMAGVTKTKPNKKILKEWKL